MAPKRVEVAVLEDIPKSRHERIRRVASGMHVSFALFADAANISQEGKLNVLGVFDAVHVAQFPALHPRATLVVRLKGSPSDVGVHPMTMRWVNARGTELWSSSAELSVAASVGPAAEMDMPVIVQLDLPLDSPGDYRMQIDLDSVRRAEVVLHVRGGAPTVPVSPGQLPS